MGFREGGCQELRDRSATLQEVGGIGWDDLHCRDARNNIGLSQYCCLQLLNYYDETVVASRNYLVRFSLNSGNGSLILLKGHHKMPICGFEHDMYWLDQAVE